MKIRNLPHIVVIACLVAACDKPSAESGSGSAARKMPDAGIITVTAAPAALTTELPGRVSSPMVSDVRPQVGGIITKRLFEEGADVSEGQMLYQIDSAPYEASLASAEASLAKARANASSLRLKAKRYKELLAINAVSKQDYDDAAAAIDAADAEIASYKADVDTALINLAYTQVRAPISGRIGKSSVTPGALVTANQTTALATIQKLDPVYVDMTQSAGDYMRLKQKFASGEARETKRKKVHLKLDDGTDYASEGFLRSSDITVNQTTGSISLRAEVPNPALDLLPGMFVRAVVEEGIVRSAVFVPQAGVTRDRSGNPTALVLGKDDKVEKRDLHIDRTVGNEYLVTTGLKNGDRLIVDGLQKIKVGMTVKPVKAASSIASAKKPDGKTGDTTSGETAGKKSTAQPDGTAR